MRSSQPTPSTAWVTRFRRLGAARAGAVLRVAQDLTVVGIGLTTGPIGLLAAYLATMAVHGAANPVHQGMLHRAVVGPSTRATVVSPNSLTAKTGGALGGIALGAFADAAGLTTATLVGAAVLAARLLSTSSRDEESRRRSLTPTACDLRPLGTRGGLPHHRTLVDGRVAVVSP
ncbi:MAG: hypothetical protein ACR2K2_07145 [Mycobacteriales bacterium]